MDRLIPQEWFTGQPQWLLLMISVLAMAALIKAAGLLVDGVAGIAYKLNISKVVVAATILSLGTTSPEAAVSVQAAMSGNAGLALGNAVGSVICNAALIFGLGCLVGKISVDQFVLTRQGSWLVAAVLLVAVPALGLFLVRGSEAAFPRGLGVVLLAAMLIYLWRNVRWARVHPHGEPFNQPDGATQIADNPPGRPVWMLAGLAVVGLLVVLPASRVFVACMIELADRWGVPQIIVAATIVSIGTSLPELVISVTSVRKGHGEVLVGNVIGANIMNLLFVLGASAIVAPLPLVDPEASRPALFVLLHVPFMLLTVALFYQCVAWMGRRATSHPAIGWLMLAIYAAYVGVQFALG
jgi:cation:H+ antiporter